MTSMQPTAARQQAVPAFLAALAATTTLLGALLPNTSHAQTELADKPVFSNTAVPGNLALALSVEWPTVSRTAHPGGSYSSANIYRGYFDHDKCYQYVHVANETASSVIVSRFDPVSVTPNRECASTGTTGEWSGNFLNWATMIAIDPFRWALTGGYRRVDQVGNTVLERARHSGQGLFPNRTVTGADMIGKATPFTWGSLTIRTNGAGTRLIFSSTGNVNATAPTRYDQAQAVEATTVYDLQVRVKVCDPALLESNCKKYGTDNYKPEGLIQAYSDRMRFSAFGYLNDPAGDRDGGVLRAAQKFVGPTKPIPGSPTVSNPDFEWDPGTGIFGGNPDATDALATSNEFGIAVANSGVINYLNKFGQLTNNDHKNFDPVSEMYYAVTRYFRNLGNVPEWSAMASNSTAQRTRFLDGFPVITNWVDPVQYSCQRNFVIGIGDIYTHRDKNLPGSPTGTTNEPSKPPLVSADPLNSVTYTNKAFALQGLAAPNIDNYSGRNNSAGMVGLAYHANTQDLRADLPGKQTLSTYWVDVLEQPFVANNQFYLAAKYGGFKAPSDFDPLTATALVEDWWTTTTDMVGTQKRPDNYFTAGAPDQMISGLTRAFADIASKLNPFTTSFSTALPQVALAGVGSYAAKYSSENWTGEITASTTVFNPTTGAPSQTEVWSLDNKLASQLSGTGWDSNRVMISFNTTTNLGVPFRTASLSASQLAALDTSYRTGNDSTDYLNYLRGDITHEVGSPAPPSAKAYRTRGGPLGNIVGSKVRAVGPPAAPYSSAANPGYAAFKTAWQNRPPMLYFGTNAGILHAVNGSVTLPTGGREVFAYVPGALYAGANGNPADTGLQHRGNPVFVHKYLVDGPVNVYDIDMGKTVGGSGAADWRSVLVGALGKGGRSYFAIDVTDPAAFSTEIDAASKVLWEFTDPDLGYTFGEPAAVKTKKYGWVLIFGSGYNNPSGVGQIFIVNPRNGDLLEKISTGVGSPTNSAGLAHVQVYIPDRTDFTAESLYAGDLLGNLWRLDLRQASGAYPAPVKLAELTDSAGNPVAVTSRPLIVVQPGSNRRFVTIGSGRLLHTSDVNNPQPQGFYAIIDGTGNAFNTDATLPSGMSFPIRNSAPNNRLLELTDLTQPIVMNFATHIGWWLNLGSSSVGGPGWRVITDPTSFQGIVAFASMTPAANPCAPSGTNRVYAIDLGKGQSVLGDPAIPLPFNESLPGVITDLRFYSVNGKPRLVGGTDTGATGPLPGNWATPAGTRRLNWRELPLAD